MSDDAVPAGEVQPAPHRHWYRLALGATIVLVLVVLGLLPLAIRSMQEVLGRGGSAPRRTFARAAPALNLAKRLEA